MLSRSRDRKKLEVINIHRKKTKELKWTHEVHHPATDWGIEMLFSTIQYLLPIG